MIKGLYIHIPFCDQICSYCDFTKQVANQNTITQYMHVLLEEFNYYKDNYDSLQTIYIGGGTPSSISLFVLERLLKAVKETIDLSVIEEYTIEANPKDINGPLLKMLKEYGVNRISLGVQTVDETLLETLNRDHSKAHIIHAIELLNEYDFHNYNLDFIYGIPSQTMDMIKTDLEFIQTYAPKHISYYALILEERTLLHYQVKTKQVKLLEDDLVADYSDYIAKTLKTYGYTRYETSNYSKPRFESTHNLIYWNLEKYLGIGLGASSQYDNHRYKNTYLMKKYLSDFTNRKIEDFSPEKEFVIMGLRKIKGISISEFKNRFHIDLFEQFPELKKHITYGLVRIMDDYLLFTEKGIDLANQVYVDII